MQTEMLHIRLSVDEIKQLRDFAEQCGHSAPSLGAMMVKAAMEAVGKCAGPFLPMKLEITETPRRHALNEPVATYSKRK